ncbi:unnamed protein product [Urochloa decumbens]|uniref:SCP domain-containing protein n=1 Tax=Urochloa decumbens TaxID=240449 RepID=A0ABC9D7I5_9POAL
MSSLTYLTVLSLLALSAASTATSAAAISATVTAPPPRRAPRGPAIAAQFLSAINAARADAGVPPLSWNATVAQRAKLHVSWLRDSAGCELNQTSRDSIGSETMIWFRGYDRPSPADVVALWVSQRPWYDRGADACVAGKVCGSYQIVVTPTLRQLGCALVACPSRGAVAACVYRGGK